MQEARLAPSPDDSEVPLDFKADPRPDDYQEILTLASSVSPARYLVLFASRHRRISPTRVLRTWQPICVAGERCIIRGEASSCEQGASSHELTFIAGARWGGAPVRRRRRRCDDSRRRCRAGRRVAGHACSRFPAELVAWHELIGPLAADGYRVLCPDLRGAGWSSAPDGRYYKTDMADDLAVVLDRLGVAPPVRVVAHDWGGPIAAHLMLRHPKKVSGFFGLNTVGPWLTFDLTAVRHLWRFWYQIPISLPVIGPRLLSDPKGRFIRMTGRWVGAGFYLDDDDFRLYVRCMRLPGHSVAGSRWYRTFLTRELIRAGEFANTSVDVPMRFLHGVGDPVITPTLLRGYAEHAGGFRLETVDASVTGLSINDPSWCSSDFERSCMTPEVYRWFARVGH